MSDIPKEWQTNKNLRYWMSQQPNEEIMSTPDDFFLHESKVIKFAKQFHKEELEKLQAENEKLKADLIEIEVGYVLTSASKIENGEGDEDYFIYKTATVCKKYGVSSVVANLKDRQQTPLIQWCIDLIQDLNKEELKEEKK